MRNLCTRTRGADDGDSWSTEGRINHPARAESGRLYMRTGAHVRYTHIALETMCTTHMASRCAIGDTSSAGDSRLYGHTTIVLAATAEV